MATAWRLTGRRAASSVAVAASPLAIERRTARRVGSASAVLIHQPTGGYQGQSSDIEIHARETLALRAQLDALYAKHTGQTAEQINADSERDRYMTPEEGVAYGLVDRIVSPR